jgi:RNA polymerase sigma factor (sigma-70 family)
MPQRQLDSFIRCLRRWAGTGTAMALTDAQLLERFVGQREEAAFEELVRSHGPMVFTLCRQLLHNTHDAEDAFQATFLVLVRKAGSISKRESVGSWLYGVAYRIASRERGRQRRLFRQREDFSSMPSRGFGASDESVESCLIINEELSRLPEKYRSPLVLHYLEGKTKDETAQQLGWPEGTVSGRLARGREMLRSRLVKRGFTASVALIASTFSANEVGAAVPPSLLVTTLQNASLATKGGIAGGAVISPKVVALARGVQRTMLLSQMKMAAASLVVACVAIAGTAWTVASLPIGQADEKPAPATQPEAKKAQKPKRDLEKMQGAWEVVYWKEWGRETFVEERNFAFPRLENHYFIRGSSVVIRDRGKILEGTIKLNSTTEPKKIDVVIGKGSEMRLGIYQFDGEKLKVCWAGWDRQRPEKFGGKEEGDRDAIQILQKQSGEKETFERPAGSDKEKEARLRVTGNLYELARSMHKYHDKHGHFPHAAIINKEGKPLLSWRVDLLPSLGFEELYNEFKLDEPWDSAHNKSLLAKIPKVFAAPEGAKKVPDATYYQVFVGKGTVFEEGKDITYRDITDGTVDTILIIEAGKAVPWTKPEDLPYSADKPIPELGGAIGDGLISFVTADAAPHYARKGIDKDFEDNLRPFITANDGQIVNWDALK